MRFIRLIDATYQRLLETGGFEHSLVRWQEADERLADVRDVSELVRACRDRSAESRQKKDRLIAALCRLATTGDEVASVLVLKLFIGLFTRIAQRLSPNEVDPEELHSEMLEAFWEEAARGSCEEKLCTRLFYAVHHRGWEVVKKAEAEAHRRAEFDLEASAWPGVGQSQGDFLHFATRSGVISESNADLIAATRLEGRSISDLAQALGVSREALTMRRQRAEAKLVRFIDSKAASL